MALIDLWPEQLRDKSVAQIIAFAGDGKLGQNKQATVEYRALIGVVPEDFLDRYINECLASRFDGSGLALQDLVNEVGRRLGFEVIFGRYRGVKGAVGFDGLWKSPTDDTFIVVEVKTTDVYSVSLDTVAEYRRALIQCYHASAEDFSTLIVVGREDTGGLEAQIRGSRYAWDTRLISVAALLRLMRLKTGLDDSTTMQKIQGILRPLEYTKVDSIVDIVFLTAEDVSKVSTTPDEPLPILNEQALPTNISESEVAPSSTDRVVGNTDTSANFYESCIAQVQRKLGTLLIKSARVIYESQDKALRVACLVSREYSKGNEKGYWFGIRPSLDSMLSTAHTSFLAFGCGSSETILLVPFNDVLKWREWLNTTSKEKAYFWHARFTWNGDKLWLERKGGREALDVTPYLIN